jgi:DNA-binding GntR family transcriptional regulator
MTMMNRAAQPSPDTSSSATNFTVVAGDEGKRSGPGFFGDDRRLSRATLKDQAMAVIRRAIVTGEVLPGQILSASALAQRLGVSNSPVRDACMALVHAGIMEVVPNRGFRMVVLDQHDVDEVYELREMLEIPAMARLARLGLQGREDELREYVEGCAQAARDEDAPEFLDYDRRFHLTMLSLLNNSRLVTTVDRLRDLTRISGMRVLSRDKMLKQSAADHADLLDAIAAGNADAAQQIMRRHMAHGATGRSTSEDESGPNTRQSE